MSKNSPAYIFLDTNVFYNDWFLNNANLRYLFHYISNEHCTLLISELVCQEVENIRRRELDNLKRELEHSWKKLRKLNSHAPELDPTSLEVEYDFKAILREKCEDMQYISYESVSHEMLVQKALKIEKPFSDGEKGYRDALIWLSLLKFLSENDVDEKVIYITNNKSDFFTATNEGVRLHDELCADAVKLGVKAEIIPYDSLFKFVSTAVDKTVHAIDRAKTEYDAEEFLKTGAKDYLEDSPVALLKGSLVKSGLDPAIVNEILSIDADIMEGVEDLDLMTYNAIDKHNVYVYFVFDLRIVYFTFKFAAAAYYANKDIMERQLMNFELDDNYVTAGIPMRAYFDASCIYDPVHESFSNFTVATLGLRI